MGSSTSGEVLDLEFLERQTFGERELQGELFALFEQQCILLLPSLGEGVDHQAGIAAAHTLKGSASAIGAHRVVAFAGALEDAFARGDEEQRPALATSLREALADVRCTIGRWRESP